MKKLLMTTAIAVLLATPAMSERSDNQVLKFTTGQGTSLLIPLINLSLMSSKGGGTLIKFRDTKRNETSKYYVDIPIEYIAEQMVRSKPDDLIIFIN